MSKSCRYDLNALGNRRTMTFCGEENAVLRAWAQGGDADILLELVHDCEHVYGMGERFNRVDQKGLKVHVEVSEQFCRQGEVSYCPMPFFMTDRGVGLWLDTLTVTEFDFGKTFASV